VYRNSLSFVPFTVHSQVWFLKLRLMAFSETARLVWSETPFGKSALISRRTLTVALGVACQ
jgi:hypothetical protein